jgi:predicted Zn-dependent protease
MKLSGLIITAIIFLLTSACSINPVTGKNELSLISESQELSIGQQQYAPLRQSQGGDYEVDAAVAAYVNEVGQRLAAVSDRKLPYEFKVLNNSSPNAWALPGGKIAINRGLLTELNSEAELAAVLGHEIVHAAAKHSAQGMSRGMLLQGLVVAASIATQGKSYANAAEIGASLGAQLVNQKYGRDAERESDQYGMKYMSRAGYDPQGAVDLQKTFVKLSESNRQDWLSGLFSSHPPSQERVQNNIRIAASLPKGGIVGRERYQKMMARLKKSKPAYKKYDDAQKALSKGQISQAKSLVKQAVALEPREGHFYSLLGDIEQKNKSYSSARKQYNKAIELNSEFFYYYLQRGLVNNRLNNNSSAKRDLQKSVNLLPTANAYKALGDIASNEQRYSEAKQYYAKAADNSSTAGKAAYSSLVKLDLQDNPGKYISVRTGVDRSGRLVAELNNTTSVPVTGIVLQVRYPDSSGRIRQVSQSLRGTLKAGEKNLVNLNISVNRAYISRVQSAVSAARIAR